jgi:hypothetical protein
VEPTTGQRSATSRAFDAAYDALMPYTRHAQVRAEIAERVVKALGEYSQFVVVEVLLANWPEGFTRLNRAVLSEVVQVAARVLKEG